MNKKKLIGAIIGVVAFAALIAGATYAWLTFNATITNGTYNLGSMNFSVSYTKGTDVTAVPIVSTPTAENTRSLNVKANKVSGSAPGTLTIYLNTDSSTTEALLTSGALHYAVCIGDCTDSTNLSEAANVSATGTVSTSGKLAMLSNTPLTASATTYNVYFWLDSSAVVDTVVGSSYTGFISAEAVQTDYNP